MEKINLRFIKRKKNTNSEKNINQNESFRERGNQFEALIRTNFLLKKPKNKLF